MPARIAKTPAALTFEEWYAKPIVQPLASSESLGWQNVVLHTSRLRPTRESMQSPVTENHFLQLLVSGATEVAIRWNGKVQQFQQTAGSLNLHPAGTDSSGSWSSPITVAFVQLSPHLIVSLADTAFRGDPMRVQMLPKLNFRDPLLQHLVMELYNELHNPGLLGTLFVESAAYTIMLHLLRKYSTASVVAPQPAPSRFSPQQICLLNDYIESHLDQKISLTDLANLMHMSVSHFERTFRTSLSYPPYHYVLERRVDRAKLLLQHSEATLYEIARQCGFANQSHFTRHFTQFVGVSPARFAALAKK
jgi:AraC family transcriptional regulator